MAGGQLASLPGNAASSRVNERSYLQGTRKRMAEQVTQRPPPFSLGVYVNAGTCTQLRTAPRICRNYGFIRVNRQRIELHMQIRAKCKPAGDRLKEGRVDSMVLSLQAQTGMLLMFTSKLG